MTKHLHVVLIALAMCFFACSKSGSNPETENNGPSGTEPDNSLPYIEYEIGGAKSVRVDCREISFSAKTGEVFGSVFATSASTKATFSFAFPAFSGDVEKKTTGAYPIKPFIGYAYDTEAFHFSFRAPKTAGGNDYYISIAPTSNAYKNNITKITKADIESGKQVFWIDGDFNLQAVNAEAEDILIKGRYRFKIFTLLTATVVLPGLKTIAITDTTSTSAKVSAEVTFDGNATVTEKGVCWGLSPEPTIDNGKIGNGGGTGAFNSEITGLAINTKYFVRAYATNSKGTAYGNQIEFSSKANLPAVTTNAIDELFPNYAKGAMTIVGNGGSDILHSGLCWSTSQNPTTSDNKTDAGLQTPTYELVMKPLKPNTTYYYRAYATSKAGTAYGKQVNFKTGQFNYGKMVDVDGNGYRTIKIGNKTWMADNLRVTSYRNGELIPYVVDNDSWNLATKGAYTYYNRDPKNNVPYGKLYNWHAVNDGRNLAPVGWHIPTAEEVRELNHYLNFDDFQDTGTEYWEMPNSATNKNGFAAVGSGICHGPANYQLMHKAAMFWTSDQFSLEAGRSFNIMNNHADHGDGIEYKTAGLAIRCVKDN
ncbi:MAG TPA: fibrobacter succinogenes major paralogous domain-containing protein [Pedobacter sp.]|nr:fibrobacter succinogenes major paralogous domain-containing protein [Pedobacter sp.]